MSENLERNLLSVTNDKIILDGFSELGNTIIFQLLSTKGVVIYPHSESKNLDNKLVSNLKEFNNIKICDDPDVIKTFKNMNYSGGYFLFLEDRYYQI